MFPKEDIHIQRTLHMAIAIVVQFVVKRRQIPQEVIFTEIDLAIAPLACS